MKPPSLIENGKEKGQMKGEGEPGYRSILRYHLSGIAVGAVIGCLIGIAIGGVEAIAGNTLLFGFAGELVGLFVAQARTRK